MGALPEDTSRVVGTVKVPETRDAGGRYLGRLGGDQTNQYSFANQLLGPLMRALFLAPGMRTGRYLFDFLVFQESDIFCEINNLIDNA